jgi:hypothetical protein
VPAAIVVVLLVLAALVIAVPVRRLVRDGRSLTTIVLYVVVLIALGVGVTGLEPLDRYLLPVLGIVYIVPFITWRAGLDRLLARRPPSIRVVRVDRPSVEPPRDVTPRDVTPPEDVTAEAADRAAGPRRPPDSGA